MNEVQASDWEIAHESKFGLKPGSVEDDALRSIRSHWYNTLTKENRARIDAGFYEPRSPLRP